MSAFRVGNHMEKPKTIEVGQIWRATDNEWTYDCKITSVTELVVTIEVLETNNSEDRPGGYFTSFYISTLLTNDKWSFIRDCIPKVISTRKRPQLSIVVCRGCGSKLKWIKGTSKRNYLCIPCRRSLNAGG